MPQALKFHPTDVCRDDNFTVAVYNGGSQDNYVGIPLISLPTHFSWCREINCSGTRSGTWIAVLCTVF